MELFSGHESFLALSNRGAPSIFDASFKFARASYLLWSWSTVHLKHRAFGGEFFVSSTVIGVCIGLMSAFVPMHRKRASRSRFVKDVVSWLRRWAVSRNGQGSRAAPGPSVPGRVRFAPSRRRPVWSIPVRTRKRCLARKESRADFPEVSLHLLDPSEWKLAAYGGFFREENIIILEARSILCAVQHAESRCSLGRLL